MGAITREALREQEQAVLSSCIGQVLATSLGNVTIKSIAEASGLREYSAYRAVKRLSRDRDHLIQRGVAHLCSRIIDDLEAASEPGDGVFKTIELSVAHSARVVSGPNFTGLYGLVLREGALNGWLRRMYAERVSDAFCRWLEDRVYAAGERGGAAVFCHSGATHRVLQRLEWAVVLPRFVPGGEPARPDDENLIRDIAREALAATHGWSLGEVGMASGSHRQRPREFSGRASFPQRASAAAGPS